MAAAGATVRPTDSLTKVPLRSVISDLTSLDLNFLTLIRDNSTSAPAHELEARPHDVRKEELHSRASLLSDHHTHPSAVPEEQDPEQDPASGEEGGLGGDSLQGEEQVPREGRHQGGEDRADQKEVLRQEAPAPGGAPAADGSAIAEFKGLSPALPASIAQEGEGPPSRTGPANASATTAKAGPGPAVPAASATAAAAAAASRGATPASGAAGGVPAKEPVTCQVACLSWPGSKDGFKKSNQDAYAFMRTRDKRSLLFGVFDGHGPRGRDASQAVKQRLPELLMDQGDSLTADTQGAFAHAFAGMQSELLTQGEFDCGVSGTTAVMAHLYQRTLTVAWAGDSRAVLAKRTPTGELLAVAVSDDHKPENEEEKERIEANNGCVYRDVNEMGEDVGPHRVWTRHGPMLGLAMSRSLGDRLAHSVGVSAVPQCKEVGLTSGDCFLILASDGVWEWVSNEEAVGIVAGCATANEGARKLMHRAKAEWLAKDIGSYVDDITALVVKFTHNDEA